MHTFHSIRSNFPSNSLTLSQFLTANERKSAGMNVVYIKRVQFVSLMLSHSHSQRIALTYVPRHWIWKAFEIVVEFTYVMAKTFEALAYASTHVAFICIVMFFFLSLLFLSLFIDSYSVETDLMCKERDRLSSRRQRGK